MSFYFVASDLTGSNQTHSMFAGSGAYIESCSKGFNVTPGYTVNYNIYRDSQYYAADLCIFLAKYLTRKFSENTYLQTNNLCAQYANYRFYKVDKNLDAFNDEFLIEFSKHEITEAEFIGDIMATKEWGYLSQVFDFDIKERVKMAPLTLDIYVDQHNSHFMHNHMVLPGREPKAGYHKHTVTIPLGIKIDTVDNYIQSLLEAGLFQC